MVGHLRKLGKTVENSTIYGPGPACFKSWIRWNRSAMVASSTSSTSSSPAWPWRKLLISSVMSSANQNAMQIQENVTTCRANNRKEFLRKLLYKTLVKKTHLEDNLSRAATGDSFRQMLIWQSFMPTLLSKEPAEASERKLEKTLKTYFK